MGPRDVHPLPFTYDEVTNNGIATALAIKNSRSNRRGQRPGDVTLVGLLLFQEGCRVRMECG
jgi:hypothetical protein